VLSNNDQQALLAWYDEHQRDLPWRQTNDPWAILLSEILLQQTQVSRGLIYWKRMVETFPTVASMAASPVDAVLKAWEGAGYYSRARRLHALSQRVMMPKRRVDSTLSCLQHTTNSFPFQALVLTRRQPWPASPPTPGGLCGRQHPPGDGSTNGPSRPHAKAVQEWADGSLETERPGDWNQSLMELGATVCTPKRWACGTCPLRASCAGIGDPGAYPTPKKQRVTALHLVAVVEFALDGHPVLHQRPMSGMFAGLWGPMYREDAMPKDEGLVDCGTVNHQLSHKKIKVQVYLKLDDLASGGTPRNSVALSSLDEKVLNLALEYANANPPSQRFEAKG